MMGIGGFSTADDAGLRGHELAMPLVTEAMWLGYDPDVCDLAPRVARQGGEEFGVRRSDGARGWFRGRAVTRPMKGVPGEVRPVGLAPAGFIGAHHDPGVGAADEGPAGGAGDTGISHAA